MAEILNMVSLMIVRRDDGSIVVSALKASEEGENGKLQRKITPLQLDLIKKFAPDVYRFLLA